MPSNRLEAGQATSFFVIIGAQRCGSTMLRRALADHPEIQFLEPEWPEPRSFMRSDAPVSADEYRERFGKCVGRVLGEKSTSYIDRPDSAARIANALPGAKIIAIVREPLARAVSHYRFSFQNRAETLDLAEALTPEAEARSYDTERFSVSPFHYLIRGRYIEHLQPWVEVFGLSRVHVVVFEELVAEPATLSRVHRYLGVEERPPQRLGVVNPAEGPIPALGRDRVRDIRNSFAETNLELARMFGINLDTWTG
jgi:hypothetical protein